MLNQKGMTLLEIMIVLVILGGLMAALSTSVLDIWDKAKYKQAKIQVNELEKALVMYVTDCGTYPSEEAGLEALHERTDECPSWGPRPYVKTPEFKDPWGRPISYEIQDGVGVIIIWGKDDREGGADLNQDIYSAG